MKNKCVIFSIWLYFVLSSVLCLHGKGLSDTAYYERLFEEIKSELEANRLERAYQRIRQIPLSQIEESYDTVRLYYYTFAGRMYLHAQENAKADSCLRIAINLCESLRFKFPAYLDLLLYKGFSSDALNNRDDAMKWYRKVIVKAPVVEHNADIVNCAILNLANIYNERGEYGRAKAYYEKIEWIDSLQRVEIHPDYYGCQTGKYIEYGKQGEWGRARNVNDSLLNYCYAKYGVSHPFYLSCLQSKATIERSLGQNDASAESYHKIIDISKNYGLTNSETGRAYISYIETLCNLHRVDDAMAIYPEAKEHLISLQDPTLTPIDPLLFIGNALVDEDQFEEGAMVLEVFLSNWPEHMSWAVPYAINKLTWAYVNSGRNQEATDILMPLVTQSATLDNKYISLLPHLYRTLGCAQYALGLSIEAKANLLKAVQLSQGEMDNDLLIQDILRELSEK